MKSKLIIISLYIVLYSLQVAPQRAITLEDIWLSYKFFPEMLGDITPMNDGQYYSMCAERTKIVQYDYKTGKKESIILDIGGIGDIGGISGLFFIFDYQFSPDESKILIATRQERIYRYSKRSVYYIYDIAQKKAFSLDENLEKKQQLAEFSPDSKKIAYMQDNNLYIKDLNANQSFPVTDDGANNAIINGAPDWVYEEEFSFSKAFEWSPDSKKLAYIKFDEQNVKEYSFPVYDGLYPSHYTYKYPKSGEENSVVSVHIFDLMEKTTLPVDIGQEKDIYIPRIKWTKGPGILCIIRLNRLQNKMDYLLADALTGKTKIITTEENKYYVNLRDNLFFLNDKRNFITTAEKDGWNHVYIFNIATGVEKQITSGQWEVTQVVGENEKENLIYYLSTEDSPLERQLYSINTDGSNKTKITQVHGTHEPVFSKDYQYFINTFSDANTPYKYSVYDNKGKEIRIIEENAALKNQINEFGFNRKEFFKFKTTSGAELYGYLIKPPDFKPGNKYPLFMHLYGGPGYQAVTDSWDIFEIEWQEFLAQQGYVVASIDNRGTDYRGENFSKTTYMQMGKLETEDQTEATKYFINLGFIDDKRIGIQGWSYGGTLATLCLLKEPEIFKAAIAVAPVTNWRYYDNIYTERYMRTPQENPQGYDDNSPINHAEKLKGKYLLIHGTADDNVHYQNSMELAKALINAGKQFDMMSYPDNDHGIMGGMATRYQLYTKMWEFIKENL
ncbi:MAG: S9 family peptidase [Bacteroidia bacterium]|nr:S9 family peptidase [Bacteroidia bacterium]